MRTGLVVLILVKNAAGIQNIFLDASNLQLFLRPGGVELGLGSLDQPQLVPRLDMLTKLFEPHATCTAVFDGAAFDGVHADTSWSCDPEVTDASPLNVRFTGMRESADDALVALAQNFGLATGSSAASPMSTGHARSLLENPLPTPRPVFSATLLKSAMGKSKRDRREAFLKTCGLLRMGDTVHLPTFLETQQERSLALIRGLHSIERGVIQLQCIERPTAMVISDDRGLRRRCFALANPPVVMGRNQFFNMLDRIALEAV